jgi:hypothetical protein
LSEELLKNHKSLYDKAFNHNLDERKSKPIYKPGAPLCLFLCDDNAVIPESNNCNYLYVKRGCIESGALWGLDIGFSSLLVVCGAYLDVKGYKYSRLLINDGDSLRLLESPSGINTSFPYCSKLYSLLSRFFYDLSGGRVGIDDLLENIKKLDYFSVPRKHPVMSVNGKKLASYLYLNDSNVRVPKLYSGLYNDRVYEKSICDFLKEAPDSFVLKAEAGCSGIGVHVLKKKSDFEYYDLLQNKTYKHSDIANLAEEYGNFIIEEKLGGGEEIPIDIKCYSFDGVPKYIMIFDRNYKKTHKSVFALGYCVEKGEFERNPFLNYQRRFVSPASEEIFQDMSNKFLNVGVGTIIDFVTKVLKDLDCKDFLSVDVFSHHDCGLYVGEVTKTPGAFFHHLMRASDLKYIFS